MSHTLHAIPRALRRGTLLTIGALALATACKKDEPGRRRARLADDPTAAETPTGGGSGASDADEIRGYRLRMDKIRRYYDAGARLAATGRAQDSALMNTDDGSPETIDAMAAAIEREPAARAAVEGAGLSPREFTLLTLAYMQAAMAGGVAEQQGLDDRTAAEKMSANADNIRFVREHKAELDRLQRESEAKVGGKR